jgi:hypothetical protein
MIIYAAFFNAQHPGMSDPNVQTVPEVYKTARRSTDYIWYEQVHPGMTVSDQEKGDP